MTDWSAWIGREERRSDRVTDAALARFRATIGGAQGEHAPPGFHWCLCTPDAPMDELGEDGHPKKGGFLPPVPLPRRMWAASELGFRAPIPKDAEIERVSTVASIEEKQGKSGLLVFVEVDHVTSADGKVAVRERQSLVYREAARAPMELPRASGAELSAWPVTRSLSPDPVLLFRFSALTFNSHRIHYDLAYAEDEEGYPGLVVHGPLTATLLLTLAAEELGEVKRFSFRGLSPAFAGQPLHLAARSEGKGLAMEAIGGDGRTVMQASAG